MNEDIDEAMMKTFAHRVFRKRDNIGRLTVKSLRHQFLEHLGLEKLEAYQREVFKKTVHNVYAFYTNKNQGQSEGDQESSVEDSQTADDSSDATTSTSSFNSKQRQRKHSIDNKKGSSNVHDTNLGDICDNEILDNTNDLSGEQYKEQREANEYGKEAMDKENIDQRNTVSNGKSSQKLNGKSTLILIKSKDKEQIKRSPFKKRKISQDIDDDPEIDEERTEEKSIPKKVLVESVEDAEVSNDDSEVVRNNNISKKKKTLESDEDEEPMESNHDIDDEIHKQTQGGGRKNGHEADQSDVRVNDDDNSWKGKQKGKSEEIGSSRRKKKSSPPSADSVRLKNLKRFVRTCGLRKNYVKLFAACNSMSQKETVLETVLRKDTGFEGRISLGMCKEFKQAREEADEVAELDCGNIISTDGGGRPTRSSRIISDRKPTPSTVLNSNPKLFSRLQGVVDSDSSNSEDEYNGGKNERSTSPYKNSSQGNSKKRRRVDSSSDDDEE